MLSRDTDVVERGRDTAEDAVWRTARAFRALLDGGWSLPLPGCGATLHRWQALADLGATDLPLARLAEGHADAEAILAELDGPAPTAGARLGVWAAEPPDAVVRATRGAGGWRLSGRKAWCSGARVLSAALVTAHTADGRRLFLVDLDAPGVRADPAVWAGPGMAGSDTADVWFDELPAEPVGGVGSYLDRPGFWHGGIGVAAVWVGGARGVAEALRAAVLFRAPDLLLDAALGAADVALHGVHAALQVAAAETDADPADVDAARLRACRVRALAAAAGEQVLAVTGRALGAGPLAHDAAHAYRVADLTVYLRQHHAERDLATLGGLLRTRAAGP